MSTVELALVLTLLLMIALGAFEYGMVFRDSLTVATASREAGRVAASTANHGDADCVILEAAAGALQSLDAGAIDRIHIYKTNVSGVFPPPEGKAFLRSYSPRRAADTAPLVACDSHNWTLQSPGPGWAPELRVNHERDADWVGVRIDYDHRWITNFLWWNGTIDLSDEAVFRIEPPAPT